MKLETQAWARKRGRERARGVFMATEGRRYKVSSRWDSRLPSLLAGLFGGQVHATRGYHVYLINEK